MIELQPVKGTRDFFPEQMRLRNWLFEVWRSVALQFGFEEYDACILEHAELYTRKAGDEITQQLYNFKDKGARELSLRPEVTPSLARMVLRHQKALSFPLKWFTIAQCFRYERMTKGRRREHFQWNADIIGQPSEVAEAEVLCMLLMACKKMGLTSQHIRIYLNDRRILNAILEQLAIPQSQHLNIMIVMDKRDKVPPDVFATLLQEQKMSLDQVHKLVETLSLGSMQQLADRLGECEGMTRLQQVMQLVDAAGLGDYLQFDVSIVRGLSYYTGMVFEVNDTSKSQRAICGGGRYDSLLSSYGGETIPAVGFGFGDVVIADTLAEYGKLPEFSRSLDYMVVPFSMDQMGAALRISNRLRDIGKRVECDMSLKKVKKALQKADELGVQQVLMLFPDELAAGEVVLRNMETREQTNIKLEELMIEES